MHCSQFFLVTGLHELDEYIQGQLLLAVSSLFNERKITDDFSFLGIEYYYPCAKARWQLYCKNISGQRCLLAVCTTENIFQGCHMCETPK